MLARFGVDVGSAADCRNVGFTADSVASLISFFSSRGPMRDRHGLAEASAPLYFAVWQRGGTLIASRQSSESGPVEAAIVPSL